MRGRRHKEKNQEAVRWGRGSAATENPFKNKSAPRKNQRNNGKDIQVAVPRTRPSNHRGREKYG